MAKVEPALEEQFAAGRVLGENPVHQRNECGEQVSQKYYWSTSVGWLYQGFLQDFTFLGRVEGLWGGGGGVA